MDPREKFKFWGRPRPGPRKISKSGTEPDQDRKNFQNLGPDRARTKKNFETWDRTGLDQDQEKFRNLGPDWTGLDQDQEKFPNLGQHRTRIKKN